MVTDLLEVVKEFRCLYITDFRTDLRNQLLGPFLVDNLVDKTYLFGNILVE